MPLTIGLLLHSNTQNHCSIHARGFKCPIHLHLKQVFITISKISQLWPWCFNKHLSPLHLAALWPCKASGRIGPYLSAHLEILSSPNRRPARFVPIMRSTWVWHIWGSSASVSILYWSLDECINCWRIKSTGGLNHLLSMSLTTVNGQIWWLVFVECTRCIVLCGIYMPHVYAIYAAYTAYIFT